MKTIMVKLAIAIYLVMTMSVKSFAQSPDIQWQKSLGGSNGDFGYGMVQDSDYNYIVAGDSYSNDEDVTDHHGTVTAADAWIAKLDVNGSLLWKKSYGGTASDGFFDIRLDRGTNGYIAVGYALSNDGDVTDHHGTSSYSDFWVVKLDVSGNVIWKKSFGGSLDDVAESIRPVSDGYIVVGSSKSSDGDVTSNHGDYDFWIIKLDLNGNLVWQKSLGGVHMDWAKDVVQTSTGEYVVVGFTESDDGDVSFNHGFAGYTGGDFWVVKLNASGNMLWEKTYGGSIGDYAEALQRVSDNEFVIVGGAFSFDGDVSGKHGNRDFWMIDIDGNGALNWQKCYGGGLDEWALSIERTNENGFIIGGYSESKDGQVRNHHGKKGTCDYWIVKTDASGNLKWQNSFGGKSNDFAFSLCRTLDGGYATTGWCYSDDGEVAGHHGTNASPDYWALKLRSATIETVNILGSPFCPEAILDVAFTTSGTFNTGNVFTAQLSGKNGKFDSPTTIGTINFAYADTGIISAQMPSKPKAGSKYRIRVVSSNPPATGTDNNVNLELRACEQVTNLTSTGVNTNYATISWTAVPCFVKYKVQYRKQGTSSWTSVYTTSNSQYISGLPAHTVYEYRVQTYCSESGSSTSAYTAIQIFTTADRLASADGLTGESLSICPNPSSGNFLLALQLKDEKNAEAAVQVINLVGQIIFDQKMEVDNGSLQKEIQLLPTGEGMYLLRVMVNDEVFTQQVVIAE